MDNSTRALRLREVIVLGALSLLFFFWVIPITGLAGLLSYKEIKKTMPWLGHLIDSNEKIRAIVQNSLPSVAMITLNALLPFVLEGPSSLFLYGAGADAIQLSPMYRDSAPGVWSSTHS